MPNQHRAEGQRLPPLKIKPPTREESNLLAREGPAEVSHANVERVNSAGGQRTAQQDVSSWLNNASTTSRGQRPVNQSISLSSGSVSLLTVRLRPGSHDGPGAHCRGQSNASLSAAVEPLQPDSASRLPQRQPDRWTCFAWLSYLVIAGVIVPGSWLGWLWWSSSVGSPNPWHQGLPLSSSSSSLSSLSPGFSSPCPEDDNESPFTISDPSVKLLSTVEASLGSIQEGSKEGSLSSVRDLHSCFLDVKAQSMELHTGCEMALRPAGDACFLHYSIAACRYLATESTRTHDQMDNMLRNIKCASALLLRIQDELEEERKGVWVSLQQAEEDLDPLSSWKRMLMYSPEEVNLDKWRRQIQEYSQLVEDVRRLQDEFKAVEKYWRGSEGNDSMR